MDALMTELAIDPTARRRRLWAAAGIVVLNFVGFIIFRGTNIQKHHFRKDPRRPIFGKPACANTRRTTPLWMCS